MAAIAKPVLAVVVEISKAEGEVNVVDCVESDAVANAMNGIVGETENMVDVVGGFVINVVVDLNV